MTDICRGTQILYVPPHINRADVLMSQGLHQNFPHGVEAGFVTSVRGEVGFCRFWHHDLGRFELRTRANSEGTPLTSLLQYQSVAQWHVDEWLLNEA